MAGVGGRTLAVIGAGVAGLSVAAALQRAGFAARVFERSARASAHGALLLWSNALRALRTLGLEDAVLERAARIEQTEFRSWRGELLTSLPIEQWSSEAGAATVVVRRSDLLDVLRSALPPECIEYGTALESFSTDEGRVRAQLDSGRVVDADGLIGADGLHSVVRSQLIGHDEMRPAGYDAWVGIAPRTPATARAGTSIATLGHGPRFWHATLADGAVFWFATIPSLARERLERSELIETFAEWHDPVPELIESTPDGAVAHTSIRDRLPAPRWGSGAATLVGDAAHPSTPDLGQGACQAIESAVTLAECMAGSPRVADAFRTYEQRRMRRTATVTRMCWLTSLNSGVSDPTACKVRDLAIRYGLRAAARPSLQWLLAKS